MAKYHYYQSDKGLQPDSACEGVYEFCGIATPFRGVRVYTRSAMGIPGSEVALKELLSRVLGQLIQEGGVAKIADDLYIGGNSREELLNNRVKVLEALNNCDLMLSRSKTIVNPKTATILGWLWTQATLPASPHRLATFPTCNRPEKVKAMKSFIGAFKILSRVVPPLPPRQCVRQARAFTNNKPNKYSI